MTETPTVDANAYQDLDAIRRRVDYRGDELFDSQNAQLEFDRLLVRLERESRGIFETLWGDQTPLREEGRTDVLNATRDSAIMLAYPIQDIDTVETRRSSGQDWRELADRRYRATDHRLILEGGRRFPTGGRNTLADTARRATWADLATEIRVTYDRGFGEQPPADIQSIQIVLINRLLRQLRNEQTVAAADPEQLADASAELDNVVTDDIRQRIADVTSPGGRTLSV